VRRKTSPAIATISQVFNDSDINTYKTGFRYLTRKGSKIDFNSTVSNASYPTQPTTVNSYNQYDNGIGFDWVATGKTRIEGKVNYTKRDYPEAPQQNYSGVTGRISADWAATGKPNSMWLLIAISAVTSPTPPPTMSPRAYRHGRPGRPLRKSAWI
jgi:Uncharacterized protein conserved in bacteria (DUF2320).